MLALFYPVQRFLLGGARGFSRASDPPLAFVPCGRLRETLAEIDLRDDAEAIAEAIDAAGKPFRRELGVAAGVDYDRFGADRGGEVGREPGHARQRHRAPDDPRVRC